MSFVGHDTTRASQLLRGVLDACLLAVIAEGDAYGYAMTQRLAARGLDGVGEGSIYPVLGRLEQQGLVVGERRSGNAGGAPRKYYALTADGGQALGRWGAEWRRTRTAIDRVLGTQEDEHGRRDPHRSQDLAPAGGPEG